MAHTSVGEGTGKYFSKWGMGNKNGPKASGKSFHLNKLLGSEYVFIWSASKYFQKANV